MKKGDTAQLAIWYCGEDDPAKIAWWRAEGCFERMKDSADYYRVEIAKPTFYELSPGESNAGHPPEGKRGTNFKLLVAEAEVVKDLPFVAPRTFVQTLSHKDLQKLRQITRTTYATRGGGDLGDEACDEIIEALGPDVVESLIYEAAHATKH